MFSIQIVSLTSTNPVVTSSTSIDRESRDSHKVFDAKIERMYTLESSVGSNRILPVLADIAVAFVSFKYQV